MATWTDPATINTDPKDPMTSEFGTAALENPEAMAEGASGAPKVEAAAVNLLLASVEAGRNVTSSADATDLDRVDTVIVHGAGSGAAGLSANATYQLSTNNGVSFGSSVEVFQCEDTGGAGFVVVDMSAHNAIRINATGADIAQAYARAYALGVTGTSP